jgi:hypothetical protein
MLYQWLHRYLLEWSIRSGGFESGDLLQEFQLADAKMFRDLKLKFRDRDKVRTNSFGYSIFDRPSLLGSFLQISAYL